MASTKKDTKAKADEKPPEPKKDTKAKADEKPPEPTRLVSTKLGKHYPAGVSGLTLRRKPRAVPVAFLSDEAWKRLEADPLVIIKDA